MYEMSSSMAFRTARDPLRALSACEGADEMSDRYEPYDRSDPRLRATPEPVVACPTAEPSVLPGRNSSRSSCLPPLGPATSLAGLGVGGIMRLREVELWQEPGEPAIGCPWSCEMALNGSTRPSASGHKVLGLPSGADGMQGGNLEMP